MDCAEARELMELAALEPGRLDRLMSGDTADAAALAAHLAGCPGCTAELASLRRTLEALELARPGPVEAAATAEVPAEAPAELRARTLGLIATVGRPRTPPGEPPRPEPIRGPVAWFRRPSAALIAIAAAVAFALLAAGSFVVADLQDQLEANRAETARLRDLSTQMGAVLQEPGSQLVTLAGADGSPAGALALGRSSENLVVLTRALPAPPAGQEYRCWVEVGGTRRQVGRMWWSGDLAYWGGWVAGIGSLPAGTTFGVSLEPIGGPGGGRAVLSGVL